MAEQTKKERLDIILAKLQNVGQIDACAIVSREGLLMASRNPQEVDVKIFSALCASVIGASETALAQMKKGNAEQVTVKGQQGTLLINPAGNKAVLVVLAQQRANLGLIIAEMESRAVEVAEVLS